MRLFHRTIAAGAILADGFRDGTWPAVGVWLSDVVLDENEGAKGPNVLAVEVPQDVLDACEWQQESTYREWCVPAAILNAHSVASRLDQEEVEALSRDRWSRGALAVPSVTSGQGATAAPASQETGRPVSDRFQGMKPGEAAACMIAERVLGARADPRHFGTIGSSRIDAALHLQGGRLAAFEIIRADNQDGGIQRENVLARSDFEWDVPTDVNWWWTVQVGHPRDIPRLRRNYAHIARLCEAAGARRPEQLHRYHGTCDPEIAWLVRESTSTLFGAPDVPARVGGRTRRVMVVPDGRGGGVDRSLTGLSRDLSELFAVEVMVKHFAKLAAVKADERHLFVSLHWTALSFGVADGLSQGDDVPPEPPPLPLGISHLWLAHPFARRVLLWAPSGWENHYPYD